MAERVLDLEIDTMDAGGDGVARHGGKRILVPFTIPGERVRVRLDKDRGDPATATLVDVLRPSPHRVIPRCPHFGPSAEPGPGPCGGCAWQHIAYPEQLRLKTQIVEKLVTSAVGRGVPSALPMLAATPLDDPWGYRQKVHFVFGNAPRRAPTRFGPGPSNRRGAPARTAPALLMGHYVRGSRRIIPVRECPVHDPRGNAVAFGLRDELVRSGVTAAGADLAQGPLRHLAIRVAAGTPEIMAALVVTRADDKRLRAATRRALAREPRPDSFHVNLHARADPFIFGPDTRTITGPARMREQVAGTAFLISPTAFFQTNVRAADLLVQLVLEAVPSGVRVLDLYAGAGLFALPLARRGHEVMAIEENRHAVEDGIASLRLNRIDARHCRFVARRVEAVLRKISPGEADVVVLDPPREGCDGPVIDGVFGDLRPRLAIYVSCNPEALARDLAIIVRHGYTIERLQPIDMFPHTPHIETVAVVAR